MRPLSNLNKFMRTLSLLLAFITVFSIGSLQAQNAGSDQNIIGTAGTFAITDATIVTVSGTTILNGTVIIKDGKIAAVGQNVSVPSGAVRIDGKGLSVYPGMIDAGTNMGLTEIGGGAEGTVDVNETGNINSNAKAILAVNPHTSHINVTRVNGVTTVLSMPGGGLISGQSAVINLNGSTQEAMTVVPTFGLVVNFPPITTFAGFNPISGPRVLDFSQAIKLRDDRVKELKKAFEEAKRYAAVRDAYAKDNSLPYPKIDVELEALAPYAIGEKPVIFSAQLARDVKGVIKFVEEMKLKAIIYGGAEAWKEAEGLKKNNIPVVYTRIFNNPLRADDPYDSLFESPSKLQKAGVRFAISTGDDGANVRDLPYQAGVASAYGLTKEDALKSVTLYPAQILGIDDQFGSIEVGKVANIVVTNGDILDVRTSVEHLFITGRKIPLTSRHTEFFDAYKDRK